jgi:hypothetical protein
MDDQSMVDNYLAQIEANLKACDDAKDVLKAEMKRLKRSARKSEQLNFDNIQACAYAFGSAARWFLHPMAPNRDSSASLSTDTGVGRKGEHPTDGVI